MRKISPSAISTWEGTPVDGEKYTRQQLHVMKLKRPHWTWFVDRNIKLKGELRKGRPPGEDVIVPCPIVAWSRDRTRVLIVSPGGETLWVNAS